MRLCSLGRITRRTVAFATVAAVVTLTGAHANNSGAGNSQEGRMKIRVTIEGQTLTATLDDTTTARDFASLLPIELTLSDYSATEKVSDLPRRLATEGAPRSYKPSIGDITYYAPWGNLAIFYRPFSDSSGLIRLGAFDGPIDALRRDQPFRARFERAE